MLKHYSDAINQRDLLLSLSQYNLKVWNIQNLDYLINLKAINNIKYINACMLLDNNKYYIITNNLLFSCFYEPIHIYNIKGNKIKDIEDSEEHSYYIGVYYEIENKKCYIITGNEGHLKSFDYNTNKIYAFINSLFDRSYTVIS